MITHSKNSDHVKTKHMNLLLGVGVLCVSCTAIGVIIWLNSRSTAVNIQEWAADANTIPTTESKETANEALVLLDDATAVQRQSGPYGAIHLTYKLNEKYPAPNSIQRISTDLRALGFRPLKNDWLNSKQLSSHVTGWNDFVDTARSPVQHVHQWTGQWEDNSGNVVNYSLRYSYPENGKPNLTALHVNASWYPAASVKILQAPSQ